MLRTAFRLTFSLAAVSTGLLASSAGASAEGQSLLPANDIGLLEGARVEFLPNSHIELEDILEDLAEDVLEDAVIQR